jgi:hypothetical protein
MKRALALAALLSALPAFADWRDWLERYVATGDGYSKVMQSWVGHPPDDLVRSWGPPNDTFTMNNGHILYIYRSSTEHDVDGQVTKTRDGYGGYTKTIRPPSSYETACTAQFEIADNRIVSWRWQGQDCRSTYVAPEPQPKVEAAPPPPPPPNKPAVPPPPPKPQLPYLGVELGNVTPDVAHKLSITEPRGVLVTNVRPNSPAVTAGLSALDVIESIDGATVNSVKDLQNAVAGHHVGDMVMLGVIRGNKVERVSATLAPRG